MFDGVSGEKVVDIPLDKRFAKRFGNPYAVTHRADIHGSLLDGCKALPGLIELRTDSKVAGFESRMNPPSKFELANGSRVKGRGPDRRGRRPLGDPREDRRRPAAADHRPHVLPGGAEDRRGAEGPAPRRGDAVGGAQRAHRPLPAARLEAVQPGRHHHRQAHQRRPQRAGHARRGAAVLLALLRDADQADAHAEGVPPLDAAAPRAGGQLDPGPRRAARRRRALHAAVHGAGRGDGDGGRGVPGRLRRRSRRRFRESLSSTIKKSALSAPRACRSPPTSWSA